MNPGALDYLFGAVILAATVRCVLKGFIAEFVTVASVGGGILCGIIFSTEGARQLSRLLGESPWNRVIAFLIIFLAVYLLLKITESLLYRFLETLQLENLDRALGFFLGIIEGLLVSVFILLILSAQPFFEAGPVIGESLFARFIFAVLPLLGGHAGAVSPPEGFINSV